MYFFVHNDTNSFLSNLEQGSNFGNQFLWKNKNIYKNKSK